MIPSPLTAARGFVLRKVAGRFDACRALVSSTGKHLTHPSLLGTVGVFLLILLPILACLLAVAATLHAPLVGGAVVFKAMPGLLTAKGLREKRATLATEANDILVRAKDSNALSAEEQQKFDAIHADIENLGKQIDSVEKHERMMADLERPVPTVAGRADSMSADERKAEQAKVDAAFSAYLRYGVEGLDAEQRTLMAQRRASADGSAINTPVEQRAAQTVTTSGGGYTIAQGFSGQLEESMLAWGEVENVADVITTVKGNDLPWPTINDNSNKGRLLAINTAVTETAVTFGQTMFNAYKFSSDMVTVPVELAQDSEFNLDAKLAEWLGTRLGRIHNQYWTTGTGSSQPGGIQTGGSSALTAAGTSTITYDELLSLKHAIDPAYRKPQFGAGWMFNDGTLLKLKQLKDGEGRPLWQPGIAVSAPNTIDGDPYTINQDMPAMTTGLKPILYGALKKFKIRKVKDITLVRFNERYMDNLQIAFVAFTRMDSKVLDAGTDPIKYVTMA